MQIKNTWLVFTSMLIALFQISFDFNSINLSSFFIKDELSASNGQLQLMIYACQIGFSTFLILGSSLGKNFGYLKIFYLGVAGYGLFSFLCALTPHIFWLVCFRGLQGIASALFFPQIFSFIQIQFKACHRGLALSLVSAVTGAGMISGSVGSGLLINADFFSLSWRLIFFVLAFLSCFSLLIMALTSKPKEYINKNYMKFDFTGVILSSTALVCLFIPLTIGREKNWPFWSFLMFLISAVATWGFLKLQKYKALHNKVTLINLEIFRIEEFTKGLKASLFYFSGMAISTLIITVFLQQGMGFSVLYAGVIFCTLALSFLISSLYSSYLDLKFSFNSLRMGIIMTSFGLSIMVFIVLYFGIKANLLILILGLIFFGAGIGFTQPILINATLQAVPEYLVNDASGILLTAQQISYVIGAAVIGGVFFIVVESYPAERGYAMGFSTALCINIITLLVTFYQISLMGKKIKGI